MAHFAKVFFRYGVSTKKGWLEILKKPLLTIGTMVVDSPTISKGLSTLVQLLSWRLLAVWTVYWIPSIPVNEISADSFSVEIATSGGGQVWQEGEVVEGYGPPVCGGGNRVEIQANLRDIRENC